MFVQVHTCLPNCVYIFDLWRERRGKLRRFTRNQKILVSNPIVHSADLRYIISLPGFKQPKSWIDKMAMITSSLKLPFRSSIEVNFEVAK